jgi:hypothetical protein
MSHRLYLHFETLFCAFGSEKLWVTARGYPWRGTFFKMHLIVQNKLGLKISD